MGKKNDGVGIGEIKNYDGEIYDEEKFMMEKTKF